MPNNATIGSGDVHGQKDKTDLVGCFIDMNATNTAYQFNSPGPNSQVLATTTGTSLPSLPFTFPQFGPYPPGPNGSLWTIRVNGLKFSGSWTNTDPTVVNDETGTWTAQAGATVDDVGDEQADAASA
jgi:hypothetical protein